MYVRVKTFDGKTKMLTGICKNMPVLEFKLRLEAVLEIKKDKQRLFFRGKQLEEGYNLFDYNININDVIQVMEKPDLPEFDKKPETVSNLNEKLETENDERPQPTESLYFKVGDYVDVRETMYGAWFEGKVIGVVRETQHEQNRETDCDDESEVFLPIDYFSYRVLLTGEEEPISNIRLKDIRPRARIVLPFSSLKVGDNVMVNYNRTHPKKRGHWYDFCIKEIKVKRKKELVGDLFIGNLPTPVHNCVVIFINEVMEIEKTKLRSEYNESELVTEPTPRQTSDWNPSDFCDICNGNPKRKCRGCGCHVCGSKSDPDKQIMCDECDMAFHIWCLSPSLDQVPDDDYWFCSECKIDENEIVKAGGKLKESKKKGKASTLNKSNRDWGKGMACVGRTKECTIVPLNHFGPIPGVEVGTQWKYRLQVSEAGVHRPHVAGIHGRECDGAYSIVLSGGYEDDIDNGNEFLYTGSGGRDLSGNKRTAAVQSSDQTLSRMNKALALNCNAPLNTEKGAEAVNWRKGKPVRVVRNFKLAKHSKYAPTEGNRYDGIYKVLKYYPEKGKSGFIVWRYMFRRDDPIPSPWSNEGKKRTMTFGLEMIYPEGYLEAMRNKNEEGTDNESENVKTKKSTKRVLGESSKDQTSAKKQKLEKYKLSLDLEKSIAMDEVNETVWTSCKEKLEEGKSKFLACVAQAFTCICCMEVVYKPVTLGCSHSVCYDCVKRSITADIKTCPLCREPIKDYKVNENLSDSLLELFPGYSAGRNC